MSEQRAGRRRLPSPATVLAAIGVFAVLAGTATAAKTVIDGRQIKKGTITAKQLKKGAVTRAKLAPGAVGGGQLAPGAVGTEQIANRAVTGAKVDVASLGKVPQADHADKAHHADTAGNATHAGDSAHLSNRTLDQVRSNAGGGANGATNPLLNMFESVISRSVTVPQGGAMILISGSVGLSNNTGGQTAAQCALFRTGNQVTTVYNITIPATSSETAALTGAMETQAPGVHSVEIRCRSTVNDNDIAAVNADISAIAVPIQ